MDIVIAAFNHAKSNHGATNETIWRVMLSGGVKFNGTLTTLGTNMHMITSPDGRNTYFQASQVVMLERQ